MNMRLKKTKNEAAIIGSGFGGLTMGCRLLAEGYHVEIFEKNEMVGGRASQLKEKGYTFDLGPSLITAPSVIKEVFEFCGKKIEDYVELSQLETSYRVFFHDGSHIDYTSDIQKLKDQMAKYSKHDADNLDNYLTRSK